MSDSNEISKHIHKLLTLLAESNTKTPASQTGACLYVDPLGTPHCMNLTEAQSMALGAMYTVSPCVLLPPQTFVKRPAEWLRAITRHHGTISFAPNFAYDLCVRRIKDLDGLDLSSWRVAGCGAEPIHPPTLAAFAQKFAAVGFRDTSFLPCYGLAEHVLAATFPPRGRPLRTEHVSADDLSARRVAVPGAANGSVPLVSCGPALPGHRVQIVGEDDLQSCFFARGLGTLEDLVDRRLGRGTLMRAARSLERNDYPSAMTALGIESPRF